MSIPNLSVLVSNRWNTDVGEVGLLLDVAYKDTHTRSDEMVNQNPYLSNVVGPVPGAGSGPGTVCSLGAACPVELAGATGTPTVSHAQGVAPGFGGPDPDDDTLSSVGWHSARFAGSSAQWKPSTIHSILRRGLLYPLAAAGAGDGGRASAIYLPRSQPGSVYPGTNIISKSVSGCYNLTSDQDRHANENTFQLASGSDWAVDGQLGDHQRSRLHGSPRQQDPTIVVDDTYNIPHDGLQLTNNYNGSMAHYVTSVGNPQLDPAGEYIDQLFDFSTISKGSEWDWRIDSTYNFSPSSFIKDVVAGFRIADRSAHNVAMTSVRP